MNESHRMSSLKGGNKPNRLLAESSLYLQQHAYNPVDWYPWGGEAFEEAKRLNKPIFLSIGYSTCHWCHVMEEESFEDEAVARILNDAFISVKVDREELPQVDSYYMQAAQIISTGPLGWPLNLFLDNDKNPFFATTYLPKESQRQLPGFIQVIQSIHNLWNSTERKDLIDHAAKVVAAIQLISKQKDLDDVRVLDERAKLAVHLMFKIADPHHGGFLGSPKFPLSFQLIFALNYGLLSSDERALYFVEKTLKGMISGGMWDRICGGFCRYSVDESWIIPHFEKMLYDNALLALTYTHAYWALGKQSYDEIAQKTFQFLLTDLSHPLGGFCSAIDADTDKVEGKTYTWTPQEVIDALGPDDGVIACDYYAVVDAGICEDGRSVLIQGDIPTIAHKYGYSEEVFITKISEWEAQLASIRRKRKQPHIDSKRIVAWNGLAIWSLCTGYLVFRDEQYLTKAQEAAKAILELSQKRLSRVVNDDPEIRPAVLEDYAFFIRSLIALFEATGNCSWLVEAKRLQDLQDLYFWDEVAYTQIKQEDSGLHASLTVLSDGSEPSANAVSMMNLSILSTLVCDRGYADKRNKLAARYAKYSEKASLSCSSAFWSELVHNSPEQQTYILISSEVDRPLFFGKLHRSYDPRKFKVAISKESLHFDIIPYLKKVATAPALIICNRSSCLEPIIGREEILSYLEQN